MRFLNNLFKPKVTPSRQTAKERLQFVLVHDRAQISPQLLQTLKDEIIAVISRHVAIEQDAVEITLTQNRHQSRLQADIPLQHQARHGAAQPYANTAETSL
jgi:cell division topological specificity factor